MKPKAIEKVTKFYVDGQEFTSEEEAERYRLRQNIAAFFGFGEEQAIDLITTAEADPEGFKEIIAPLLPKRKRRTATLPIGELKPQGRKGAA